VTFIIIAIVIGVLYYVVRNLFLQPRQTPVSPTLEVPIKITVTTSTDSSPIHREKIDCGDIQETGGGFILNPKSPLPLTITGLNRHQALELKNYLDNEFDWERRQSAITYLIAQHNCHCREIDDYIDKYRPIYVEAIERLKSQSDEWETASDKDQADMLEEFRQKAAEALPSKIPHAGFNTLLEETPSDFSADDALLAMFNGETQLYQFYASQLWSVGQVRNIPADNYYRKQYESLVEKKLAKRGQDIDLEDILTGLRLKDLNAATQDLLDKPLGRKAKAVQFALTVPDIKERLGNFVAFREMFQLREPEGVDIHAIQQCFKHANAVASVISYTYNAGVRTLRTVEGTRGAGIDYWQIMAEDCCSSCNQMNGKKTKRKPARLPPFHVGCNCDLDAGYDYSSVDNVES
jgi:hypothetical protein